MRDMHKKLILSIIGISALSLLGAYHFVFKTSNIQEEIQEFNVSIRDTITVEEFLHLDHMPIKSNRSFKIASALKHLKSIKPGQYSFIAGMNNNAIINHIRLGGISVVKVRIDDTQDIYELAGKLGKALLHDSTSFIQTFLNPKLLSKIQSDTARIACIIVPNTYEFFWAMTPISFVERMQSESKKIWTSDRLEEVSNIGLTKDEAITLASIVKAETADRSEAPRIAGLYLNRLKIGMPLQSDPTTIFGKKNKKQRIYLSDLKSENPYNTYTIVGLPPGPINFPEVHYIDAVLHPEVNNFIYMCAQPGATGLHNFCSSFAQHEKNRLQYITWLQAEGIR